MNSDGIQIRLGDILHIVWKRRFLIISLTIAGFFLGFLLQGVIALEGEIGGEYTVTTSVAVGTKTASGVFASGSSHPTKDDVYLAEDMVDAVIFTMGSRRTLETVIDSLGLVGVTPKDLSQKFSTEQYDDSQVIELYLKWKNQEEGKAILYTIIAVSEEILLESLEVGNIEMIDQPSIVSQSIGSIVSSSSWLVMGILGLVAGIGIACIELLMHPTLLNLKDVENVLGLEKVAVIPWDESFFKKGVTLLSDDSDESAAFRKYYAAAAHILYNRLGKKDRCKCFYVTSAAIGEGRTTAAANLGIQLSDMGHKVLLIDLDTRNPNLGALFMKRVDYNHSLNALYRGEASIEDSIITLTGYLDLMPALLERNMISIDSTIHEMIEELSKKYEFIIIDTAPVGQSAEVLNLGQVVDTAIFVVRYDYTPVQSIKETLATMDKSGIRVLGCVVNGARYLKGVEQFHPQIRGPHRAPKKRENEGMDLEGFRVDGQMKKTDFHESIMDEFDEDEPLSPPEDISDQDAVHELLRMGISGNWEADGRKVDEERVPVEPQSGNAKLEDIHESESGIEICNSALRELVVQRSAVAAEQDISVKTGGRIPREMPISDIDLCVVVGKLFDNAIKENCLLPAEERGIYFTAGTDENWLCMSLNYAWRAEKRKKSRQQDKNIFGLESRIVQSYNGELSTDAEEDAITVTVRLPLE